MCLPKKKQGLLELETLQVVVGSHPVLSLFTELYWKLN